MMKSKSFWGMALISLLLAACNDDAVVKDNSVGGRLSLLVNVESGIQASTTVTNSRAADGGVEAEDVTRDDLIMVVTSHESGGSLYYYLSSFDENTIFPIGVYDIEAYYGDPANEGFGNPYYYGIAKDIEIKKDATTPVALKAQLSNAMFTIKYTDKLKGYLAEYCAYLKSAKGTEAIAYPADATRRVYMQPGNVDISLQLKKKNGTEATVNVCTVNAEVRHHYGVTIDVKGDVGGENGATLTIEFDDQLAGEETIEIPLDDAALAVPEPTVTASGFDPADVITHTEGAIYSQDLLFDIYAPGKIKAINLTTTNYERLAGWPETIDLTAANASMQETLKGLGLQTLGVWKNPDEMAQINFKDVLQHVALLTQEAEVDFTLTVTDKNGKSSPASTLKVLVQPFVVQLAIANPTPASLALGETALIADVTYNGTDIDQNVKVQYNDEAGVWHDAEAAYTAVAGQENSYKAAISALPTSGDLQLRLLYTTGEYSDDINITRTYPAIKLSVDETDVWAKTATFKIVATDGTSVLDKAAETLGVKISTDGTNYSYYAKKSVSGDYVTLTDLTPGTAYSVKATLSGKDEHLSDAITFTTEAATQLPNNGMENWYTVAGATQYWWVEYPGTDTNTVWGTMNLLTTSIGGSDTGWLSTNRNGTAYCAFSGTRKTTDSHSGNAAIIETVGWGKGNTAAGSGASICKNVTAGELYLGSYNSSSQSPVYNYPFSSRPVSVSFWYKYRAKHASDYGTAEVTVLDASNNVIATYSVQLTSKDSYTEMVLPLEYTVKAKAANLHVVFKSSGNSACIKWDTNHMDGPSIGAADGRFVGSSLYIDDIQLNY